MRRICCRLSLLFLIAACSTATRPANVAAPSIVTRAAGSIFFGSLSSAPVTLEVDVTNHAQVPLRVREIEISSPGMVQYTLRPVRRIFNETIAPGETRTMALFTTAYTRTRNPSEPLTLRTIVTLEAEGKRFREIAQ